MLCARSACVRQIAGGGWDQVMRFWRFLANERVTPDKLIEGWSEQTREVVRGRHVLAIQDSSDIKFSTTSQNRRGLGKVGKGNVFGAILHAMMAVDADEGTCLGLVGGKIWTRNSDGNVRRGRRALADKESVRWLTTAAQAKEVLAQARMITVINDREGDIYAHWARTPEPDVHLLSRVMHDHAVVKGETLCQAVKRVAFSSKAVIDLPKRMDRGARKAHLSLRFGRVVLQRPKYSTEKDLPESIAVNFVEVIEQHPPKGEKPIHWLLLTTHEVANVAEAWQIVAWYKRRWIIEQFFRSMKTQGLRIEDSQLESAEGLMKLVAIAAKAATIVIQLVQARNGESNLSVDVAFSPEEVEVLDAINKDIQGKTELQKNPHRKKTLAWAAWVIAKLGGWTGYASHKPPGPITFHNGLARFQSFAAGWTLKNV
jgi:hypothetical protein